MKKFDKRKSENGAIFIIAAVAMSVFIAFVALTIDMGMHYFLASRLQNAVDSAATAVAEQVGSDDNALNDLAYDYLAKNGFDRNGNYAGKIVVKVTPKRVLSDTALNDEDYITTAYYKVNAKVTDSSIFAKIFDIDSFRLDKSAYVKCDADYTNVPRALNYTIFGASSVPNDVVGTVNLDGKTGAIADYTTGFAQELINGINSKIIQPIKGFFGGQPNYNDLIHINLSEIVTNGDVHSNSNIMIGVQALNASRTKDALYNGTIRRNGAETQLNIDGMQSEDNAYNDYGQVTFTAVKTNDNPTIKFNHTFSNSGNQDLTHLFVQNQQYLEKTQLVLTAINSFADFSVLNASQPVSVSENTAAPADVDGFQFQGNNRNGEIFLAGVDSYLHSQSLYYNKETGLLNDEGKALKRKMLEEVLKGNVAINDMGKLEIRNQTMIVYDVDHKTARTMLNSVAQDGLSKVKNDADTHLDLNEVDTVTSDSSGDIDYNVLFTKQGDSGVTTSLLEASVLGTRINRDLDNVPSSRTDYANFAVKHALAMTFMEDTDYIPAPLMKPYFVRQIKNAIYDATTQTHKDDLGRTVYDEEGSTSIKNVVEKSSENLKKINNKTYYTDQTFANYNYDEKIANIDLDTLEVQSFNHNAASNQLFSEYKASADSGITDLTKGSVSYTTTDWTMNKKGGMSTYADGTPKNRSWTISSTTFKGYNVKDSNGNLRNSKAHINDFANEYINADVTSKKQTLFGAKAIEQYRVYYVDADSDHDDWKAPNGSIKSDLSDVKTDYNKHTGADAVAKKRAYLTNNVSFDGVSSKYSNFRNYAPDTDDVFLKSGSKIEEIFDTAIDDIRNMFSSLTFTNEPSGSRREGDVEEPTVQDPDETGIVEAGSADVQINDPALNAKTFKFDKTISADGIFTGGATDKEANYYLEDLFPGYDGVFAKDDYDNDTTVLYAINKYLENKDVQPDITVNVPQLSDYVWDSTNFDGVRQDSYPENNYLFRLESGRAFGRVSNPKKRSGFTYNMGIEIMDGRNVYLSNGLYLTESSRQNVKVGNGSQLYVMPTSDSNGTFFIGGSAGALTIGNGSTVYIDGRANCGGGDTSVGDDSILYITGDYPWPNHNRSMTVGSRSSLYIGGNAGINGNQFIMKDNSKLYIGGNLDTNNLKKFEIWQGSYSYFGGSINPTDNNSDCSLSIGDNATVIVKGDLKVNNGNTLYLGTNSTLIVYGVLDASYISANKGSTIYCGSMNGGRDSATHTISNFLCPTNVGITGNLTLTENANVFINGNFTVNKTLTINSFDRIAIWGQPTTGTWSYTTGADNIAFYANGIYDRSGQDFKMLGESAFCFNDFKAKSVEVMGQNGQLCVTNSCQITNDLINRSLCYIKELTLGGSVTNYGNMHITGNLSPSSITSTGYLRVDGNISTTGEISSTGSGSSFIVGGSVGSSSSKVAKFTNIGKASIAGDLYVSGDVINGDSSSPDTESILYVGGSITGSSLSNYYQTRAVARIDVTGAVYNGGELRATEAVNCASIRTLAKTQTENLTVSGNAENTGKIISRVITVGGTLTNGSASSNAMITANTSITVGNISYSKNLFVAGDLIFTGSNTTFTAYNTYIHGSIVALSGASSRPAVRVGNILKVDGGVNAREFITEEGTNTIIGGTLSVYSPSGDTVIENNGNLKVGDELSASSTGTIAGNAALTNRKNLVAANINCLTLVNNGEDINVKQATIFATGYIKVNGNLTNGAARHRTDLIYTREYLYVDGIILNYGQIGVNGADVNGNAITVTGDVTLYNTMSYPNGNIVYGGTFTDNIVDDVIYIAKDDNIILTRDSASTLLANSKVIEVDGNLLISSDVTDEIDGLIIGGGTVYCESKNLSLKYLTIDKTGTFSTARAGGLLSSKYNVKITSGIPDSERISVRSYGYCYIDGDLKTDSSLADGWNAGGIEIGGGEFYVNGDISIASSAYYGINAIHMSDYSKVYVNGNVTLTDLTAQNPIVIDEASSPSSDRNSVLSIYGGGHTSALGAGQFVIQNNQPEATVYLGTGSDSTSDWKVRVVTVTGQEGMNNYGSMYVYGCLNFTRLVDNYFKNSGGTYIAGYYNTIAGTKTYISDNHTFVCGGNYSCPRTIVNNASLYLMDSISLTANFEITNGTFFAANATGFDYESSRVTYVNSTIYLPKPERNGTLKYSDLSTKSSKGITGIVTEANLVFDKNATIASGTTIYVGGTTAFAGKYSVTNNGNLYLMGAINTSGAASNPFVFKNGSDSYIGPTTTGTLTFGGFLEGRGNAYIENNLVVNGNNGTATVGNRYASLVEYGKMYVFGNVLTQTGQGILIQSDAAFSCGGDFTVGSTIYNYGKFVINGNLNITDNDYVTDKSESKSKNSEKHRQGYSIKNGTGEADINAEMFVGGTQPISFYGRITNSGKLFINSSVNVQGWMEEGDNPYGTKGATAFLNYNKAKANFGGDVYLNGNELYNRQDAEFGCSGDLYFGTCILNLGKVVATGKITNNESGHTVNALKYHNGDYKTIMNGCDVVNYDTYNKHVYPNALLYCGGDLHLGVTQGGGEAGSYISFGTTYVGGNLLEYTNTGNAFYKTALWLMNNSNTFVGNDCFGGGGILTGNNSIFMCDGDFISKRSAKINVNTFMYYYATVGFVKHTLSCNDDDNFTPAYFYVGGNMFANVLGKVIWDYNTMAITSGESRTPQNYSRDLDIYSNTNMFVGGSMQVNAKLFMKQNVNLIVAGAKKLSDTSTYMILGYSGNETVFNYILNAITDSGTRSALRALNDAGYFGNDPLTFYSAQLIDQNVCSTFVVGGDATVTGTTKIRDMAKTYIYGDFYSRNYLELGKALDGKDETEAKETGFFVNGVDSHEGYSYSRAAYMYVGGNYQCGGSQRLGKNYQELTGVLAMLTFNSEPTRVYASSTLKVKGSFLTTGYLSLRHDANIYTGKSLAAYRYIDVGSYSGVYVNGNCEAITSTIKIRDQVECVVAGDMTALNAYIELGKQGDFDRGKKVTTTVTEGSVNTSCECCVECTDNIFCECGCSNCKWKNGANSSSGGESSGEDDTGTPEIDDTVDSEITSIADVTSEIQNDESDTALGSKFYIGGRLMSYNSLNGYIKVYGYSKVIVGKYVFTPQYLTLRHNADLWVLPEMYDNITYKYKPYVSNLTDDANIWQRLVDRMRQIGYEITEAVKLKNGSVYALGQMTLNKNASLMGSYDCTVTGQTTFTADNLIYFGHDFNCYAPSVNLGSVADRIWWDLGGNGKEGTAPKIDVVGFTSHGSAKQAVRMVCTNTAAHDGKNYTMRVLYKNYESGRNYKCDKCGATLEKKYFDINNEINHPVTLYAHNDINIFTTVSMSSTYLVADAGDVNIANVYSSNECYCCDKCTGNSNCQCTCYNCICDVDLRSLPNGIASYQGNINYESIYSKISALFYAPNGGYDASGKETGVVNLDSYYQEIWGCIIGNRVNCEAFYMGLHRFQNWKTLNLHIAESGNVYIISEKEYERARGLTIDDDEYDSYNLNSTNPGGADLFFKKSVVDGIGDNTMDGDDD